MMSDFIESAKNFVNAAVSRTGWEAQKQMRVRSKQGEMDKLLEQRQQLLNDLALAAMNLYQQGALTDAQLSRLCASIIELDHDVRGHETQLQDIKNEVYPADQFAQSSTTNYTPPPVNPHPSSATPPPPPPSAYGAQADPGAQGAQNCPNCGNPIRANALYCRVCGAKLR
jgi:hypothetical protein